MNFVRKLLLPAFLLFSALGGIAQDDTQFWQSYNWKFFKRDNYNLNLYVENRNRDDMSEAYGYFVGPTLRAKVNKSLSFGAAAKMIYLKGNDGFASWQRSEIEATYKLDLGKRLKFDHRTRHEYFWRDVGSDFQRYRSRLKFTLPMKGTITKISLSNEFFYDERTNDFATNRLVPISLSFNLTKKMSLSTFYMWEHRRSGSRENHILGTSLSF